MGKLESKISFKHLYRTEIDTLNNKFNCLNTRHTVPILLQPDQPKKFVANFKLAKISDSMARALDKQLNMIPIEQQIIVNDNVFNAA